jgi:hypothetical protein
VHWEDKQLYRIPEVALPTTIYLVSYKQCRKVISQTRKLFLFMIHSQSEWKVITTSMASHMGLLYATEASGKSCGRIPEIFTSPIGVPLHCQVKHSIELTPGTLFLMGHVSMLSPRKRGNQVPDSRASPKREHSTKLLTLWNPNHTHAEEIWDLATLY